MRLLSSTSNSSAYRPSRAPGARRLCTRPSAATNAAATLSVGTATVGGVSAISGPIASAVNPHNLATFSVGTATVGGVSAISGPIASSVNPHNLATFSVGTATVGGVSAISGPTAGAMNPHNPRHAQRKPLPHRRMKPGPHGESQRQHGEQHDCRRPPVRGRHTFRHRRHDGRPAEQSREELLGPNHRRVHLALRRLGSSRTRSAAVCGNAGAGTRPSRARPVVRTTARTPAPHPPPRPRRPRRR
ncbi:hypothetical protein [Amycolatopsis sp. NPDC050768]|uniref:hypothetical protein n=1 Tax=Amycolatopsis sp. NPDC050768 TaxID=3154839 RepID=UPI0033EFABCE